MAPTDFQLTLKALSDDELRIKNLADSQVWFLKDGDVMQGPYEESILKDYMAKNSAFMTHYEACNAMDMSWKPAFEHTRLQRRQSYSGQDFQGYKLLIAGQTVGPFSKEEVEGKLQRGEVQYFDLISNNGTTWMKIYDFNEFSRREPSELPFLPDETSFERSDLEVQDYLQSERKLNNVGEEDALIGLAYSGEDAKALEPVSVEEELPPEIKSAEEQALIKEEEELLPPEIELTPAELKQSKNKTAFITAGALGLIIAIVFGGKLVFNKKDSAQVATKAPNTKTHMKQNYRQNKESISFGSKNRQPAGTRRKPTINRNVPTSEEQKQKLRNSFKNARKMQQTHSQIRKGRNTASDSRKDDREHDDRYPVDEIDEHPDDYEKEELAAIRLEQAEDEGDQEEREEEPEDNADEFFEEEVGDF